MGTSKEKKQKLHQKGPVEAHEDLQATPEGHVPKPGKNRTLSHTQPAPPPTDIDRALTEVEKQLCRHFYKIVISRKGLHAVPVPLTLQMLRAPTYMFSRPSVTSYCQGSDCVRTCGAKDRYAPNVRPEVNQLASCITNVCSIFSTKWAFQV